MPFKGPAASVLFYAALLMADLSALPNILINNIPLTSKYDALIDIYGTFTTNYDSILECNLYASKISKGDGLDGHDKKIIPSENSINGQNIEIGFYPNQLNNTGEAQLNPGIQYFIVYCIDSDNSPQFYSPEFSIQIESQNHPTLLSPKLKTSEYYPEISWTGVSHVPAYHIILSDQPIQFKKANNTPSDWSIIWQAITDKTSIQYGTSDPSGIFSQIPSPPLVPGITYTLAIFNNYNGSSPANTDYNVLDFSLFTLEQNASSLIPPQNINPARGDLLEDEANILFKWTQSGKSTHIYQLYIYKYQNHPDFDSEILTPVWNGETNDTTYSLSPKSVFNSGHYLFKVFALDENVNSVVSDTTGFYYQQNNAQITINTKTVKSYTQYSDTVSLGNVDISVVSNFSSQDPIPAKTDLNGNFTRFLDEGGYNFAFSKPGYISQVIAKTITQDSLKFTAILQPFPSNIYGRILDENGDGLSGCSIDFFDASNNKFSATTNSLGQYHVGIRTGVYSVQVKHPQYLAYPDTSVIISSESDYSISDIKLTKSSLVLLGNITNENSLPIAQADISLISGDSVIQTAYSDKNGDFIIPAKKGVYDILIKKSGFASHSEILTFTSSKNIEIVLKSRPNTLMGQIQTVSRPGTQIVYASCPNAKIKLIHAETAISWLASSSTSGDYSFSLERAGQYYVSVEKTGFDSVIDTIILDPLKTKTTVNYTLKQKAKILGSLNFINGEPDNLNSFELRALNTNTLTYSEFASLNFEDNIWTYSIAALSNGNYKIQAGGNGFGLIDTIYVNVNDNVWVSGLNLDLYKSDKKIKFRLASNGKVLIGNAHVTSPFQALLSSADSLVNAPFGNYSANLIPADTKLIPVKAYAFRIDTLSPVLSNLNFNFPFIEDSLGVVSSADSLFFKLQVIEPTNIDSGFLHYITYSGKRNKTLLTQSSDTLFSSIRIPPEGGKISYYYEIYKDTLLYSNNFPSGNFSYYLPSNKVLNSLQVTPGNKITISSGSEIVIRISAFDQDIQNLASEIKSSGKISLQSNNSNLEIQKVNEFQFLLNFKNGDNDSAHINVLAELNSIQAEDSIILIQSNGNINKINFKTNITQNQRIFGGDSIQLIATGYDTSLTPPKKLQGNFNFFIDPNNAGSVYENQLVIDSNFIGKIRIFATLDSKSLSIISELGTKPDSSQNGKYVYQSILPFSPGRKFFNGKDLYLVIPDSANTTRENTHITFFQHNISPIFSSSKEKELSTGLYEFNNVQGNKFSKPPMVQFAPPASQNNELDEIGVFDSRNLSWFVIPDSSTTRLTLSADTTLIQTAIQYSEGFYYGILSPSVPLSASTFTITPNPFSPLVKAELDGNSEYGTRIDFFPHSKLSDQVLITLYIYNMSGELIRTLAKNQSVPKQLQSYYWNGKTDNNLWARNGRYLAILLVNELNKSDVKKYIKPVVLFK